jgi:hypothetical protein
MNQRILELMKQADYAAPTIAKRAQGLCELVIKDCIQTLRNNGYDDAADCLHDVHFGMDDSV